MELTQEQAIGQLFSQRDRLLADKQARMSRLQKILEYTFAHKADLLSAYTSGSTPYTAKYDATGALNAEDCASSLLTKLCPPTRRWFLLSPPAGSAASYDRRYAESLGGQTERLHNAQNASGAYHAEMHSAFEDLLSGVCCVGVRSETEKPFSISTRPVNEFTFIQDGEGKTQTIFVDHGYSAYEAAKRFGIEKLPRELQESLKKVDQACYIDRKTYVNCQRPNETWDPSAIGSKGYPFEDLWFEANEKKLLKKKGINRLRYIVARWHSGKLPWGFGPSDAAYGPIRCLDKASEIVLAYGAMAMNPPSIWSDDGAWHPMDVSPGTYIVGRATATDKGPQFMGLPSDHRIAEFLFQYYSAQIARIYMAHIFQAISDTKERTAREVAVILEKEWDRVVPPYSRISGQLFAPLIRVELELLTEYELGISGWRYGGKRLPEHQYDLDLISPIALAVKYAELQKMDDFMILQSRLAQIRPEIWDKWSLNDMSDAIGENMGVPEKWKVSQYAVNRIRERRQQLLEQQAALQQAQLAADTTNKLSKGIEPESPMAKMANAA